MESTYVCYRTDPLSSLWYLFKRQFFQTINTRLGTDISRIRIIKLAEREQLAQALVAKRLASASHIAQVKARDAGATITGWISNWRHQKQQSAETLRSPKITDPHSDKEYK